MKVSYFVEKHEGEPLFVEERSNQRPNMLIGISRLSLVFDYANTGPNLIDVLWVGTVVHVQPDHTSRDPNDMVIILREEP